MKIVKKEELQSLVGTTIGVSEWSEISQKRINEFADVTEDHQFIHINPEAAKMTPFGGTIAHGFLTLSMLSKLAESATLTLEGIKMGVNYGFEKVRFINPVPSDAKIRGHFVLKAAEEKKPGQTQLNYEVTVEIEGAGPEKPALVAEWITRQFT
jgi:acyl dehydratase